MMNPAQRDQRIQVLQDTIETLRALPVVTRCRECAHFAQASGRCEKWKAQVPEEAREAGCPEWQDGVIPF